MQQYFNQLSVTNIFKGLKPFEIEELMNERPYQVRKYDRDQYLAHTGDPCKNLMFVIEGSVRGEMTDFSGKTIKIEDIRAPGPLAAAFIFGRNNRYPVDIIANEPAVIMQLPRDVLINLLQKNQCILTNYLNVISSRTQFLSDKIRFLAFKTIREKLAHFILANGGRENSTIEVANTQEELAGLFGVTRPSLARIIGEMEAEGILKVRRKKYTIVNKEKLNKLLNN